MRITKRLTAAWDVARSVGLAGLGWGVALAPTWLYIAARWLLEPDGYWQEIVLGGLAVLALGCAQVAFLFVAAFATLEVFS